MWFRNNSKDKDLSVNFQGMYLWVKNLFVSEWAGFTHSFYFPLSPVKFQPQTEMKELITLSLISAGWYGQLLIHSLEGNWRE